MKEITIIGISLFISTVYSNAQPGFFLDFENPYSVEHVLTIDTISNPNNSWQIGIPNKEFLSDAFSPMNVIITDTINPYPVNDTSAFTIWHVADEGFVEPHSADLQGYYKVNSDSLRDFGRIDFSPDNGNLWVDLINDTIYPPPMWRSDIPVLTGTSNWTVFALNLAQMEFPIELGDTVLFRFSFISDSIDNQKDGLMFDNIRFMDFTEGISINNTKAFESNVFPNPGNHNLTISFDNTLFSKVNLDIMDSLGRLIFRSDSFRTSSISVDISYYAPGIYYYKLLNENEKKGSWGKFLVE